MKPDNVEIRITMSRELFSELSTAVMVRAMSGAAFGLLDSFLARFVEKVDDGVKEWEVKRK